MDGTHSKGFPTGIPHMVVMMAFVVFHMNMDMRVRTFVMGMRMGMKCQWPGSPP